MGLISGTVTIAATGTPQSIAATMQPGLPSLSIGGVTYAAGSATQYAKQITLQAAPGNAAAILVGNRTLNAAATTGVQGSLAAGQSDNFGQMGGGITLDDAYVMGTAGDKVFVGLVD